MEFKTKQELYDFLTEFDFDDVRETSMSNVYFLIKYENCIAPIYFTHFQNVWFPSVCGLSWFPWKDENLEELVSQLYLEEDLDVALEYERTMQRNNMHYEISCLQVSPFLPEEIEVLEVFTESQCLDWLLKKHNNS